MEPAGPTGTRATALRAGVVLACAAIGLHLLLASGLPGDLTYLAAVGVFVTIAGVGVSRPERSSASVLVAAGVVVSALGDVLDRTLSWAGVGASDSLSALAFFVGYLFLGAALLDLFAPSDARRRLLRVDAFLDAATMVTLGVMLVWIMSSTSGASHPGQSVSERALEVTAPIADLILLVFTARGIVVSRGRSRTSWLMAAGVGAWLLTGVAYVVVGSTPPDRLDTGWLVGMLLLALATRPREDPVWAADRSAAGVSRPAHVSIALVLATVPLAVPPVIHLITHRDDGTLYAPYLGMGLLLLITLLRVGRLLASEAAAREEVVRSRRYFQELADSTTDAIIVVDARLRVVFCTRNVERRLGPPHRDGLFPWIDAVDPRLHAGIEDALARTREQPGLVVQEEFELASDQMPEGPQRVWVLARFVNLLDQPDVRGIVISLSDSTARKRAELELERSRDAALAGSEAKSTFLATMSHEIRTPLNGVLGLTELMLTTSLDRQQGRYVEGIRVAGEALLQVINDILDFSKIEAGRLELDEVDFELARLLDETASLVAGPAQEKGLELVVSCAPEVPLGLRGDPVRLRQVLLNLASNAIKFTTTGEVVISARLDRPLASAIAEVRLEVVDTGIGIDPAQREHLFDAFTQADSSTTRRFGGTGLGLAICKQLVTAMGGRIGVEPRPDPGGSRFWATVPLPVAAVQPRPLSADRGAWNGLRVLVVDDSETSREQLSAQLSRWGLVVDEASSGTEALTILLRAASAGRPHAIALLDLSMPEMNGLELAARIRATPELAGTASLLLTSGTPVSPGAALPSGVAGRLVKPVRSAALHETISTVLAQRPAPVAGPVPSAGGARARILVVEDSEVNQMVAVGILEQLSYEATVAEHGLAALDALRTGAFDAVLMDCQMPTMDGYQATAEIRRLGLGGPGLPVIAMTAAAVAGDRERCLAAGMDDYISKPVTSAGVAAVLERWLPVSGPPPSPARPCSSTSGP
ncbi:hybrid sensor histidine kinase/response regulator [Nocardioides sp.]|uniref:hybrid sensor histidine kinase/response regulator n=1 Tax=Nocardioides sp. TaxID=35761 RepID=UPI002EDA0941